MNDLPRFGGPARARQRMRLAAAIGMLATAAITTGGLASLASGSPVIPRDDVESTPPARAWTTPEAMRLLDPRTRVDAQVRDAEESVARARAAIRTAREAQSVDPHVLDAYERRLDLLDETALESLRRNYAPSSTDEPTDDRPHVRKLERTSRPL